MLGSAAEPDADDPLDRRSGGRYLAWKWAMALLAGVAQSTVYFVVGNAERVRSTEVLLTPLDRAIPFLPWTSWCYMPFYAGIFAICVFTIRSRVLFRRALIGVFCTILVGAAGHLLLPAEYPRPVLHPPYPDLSSAFLAAVQRIDPPGNVFPSLHVAHTSALALILKRDRPIIGTIVIVMAAMLAVSTLTTKQHFVADVVAGYAIAFTVRTLALRNLPR